MKHSASVGSMWCGGEELYVNLCNLIVESRTPGLNDRGYGDGVHCPPLLGDNSHVCDLSKPECQKHQTIIHHLLEAVASKFFQIEVLLLPECCLESKIKERIEKKEYILVERWSMNFIHGKTESNIEVSQLLRAVRSFLHFSQLSAWLSSTRGKSPTNICYWVNSKLEALCTKFKHEPEVHSFPICKVNEDVNGRLKVEFPARTQYIPIIPCSKHPPICRYSLREINTESDVCANISLDSQIVRQLHKTCDTEQNKLTTINVVPEPTAVMLTPTSLLKTFSTAVQDGSKANRVLGKIVDIIPKKPSTFVCNYAETISFGVSQENFCYNKSRLANHLHKTELKFKKVKKDASIPLTSESFAPILLSDIYRLHQNTLKRSLKISDVPQISNLLEKSSENSLLNSIESSLVNLENNALSNSHNLSRQLAKSTLAFKQKNSDLNTEEKCVLPHKKMCCDINISSQIFRSSSAIKCTKTSHLKEKVNHIRTGDVDLQDNGSHSIVIPSNCLNDIKIFQVKHQNCSNYLFPFQCASENMTPRQTQDFVNFSNIPTSKQISNESMLSKSQQNSKTNVSTFNSEIKLFKRKCVSQLDYQNNVRKKSKSIDECNKFFNLPDSISNISLPHFSEAKQSYCLDSKGVDKNKSIERYFLQNNQLEKQGSFKQSCSSYVESKAMCNNSKQIAADFSSSNNIPKSNSHCEKYNCMKRHHICQRKQSSSNSFKSSFQLQSLQNEDKKFQIQKTNLRSCRLFLAMDQIASKETIKDLSNMISENVLDAKPISCEHDCKTSNMIKTQIKRTASMISKDRPLKRSLSEDMNKNQVLKSRKKVNIVEKTVHPALPKDFKLNKFYKFKKANHQNISKRKNISPTYPPFNTKLNSSQTVYEKSTALSLSECQNNMFSTSAPNELILKPLKACVNSTKEIQRTALSGIRNSKNISVRNNCYSSCKLSSCVNPLKIISLQNDQQSSLVLNTPVPTASRNLCQVKDESLECFSKRIAKFPKGKALLLNFEESILRGCLPMVNNVKGFRAEIGASGSFCPNHLTLPADVSFYELGHSNQGTVPYVAHVSLRNSEYYLPKKGAVQVTLFNPSETVVKMFVLNYDLSSMPPLCHTFIRQKTYSLPVGFNKKCPAAQKWLRFIIHLRFASSKTGRISLHEDFKIVVLNKTNDDAASEFNQEPRELCSFLSVPMNPTFSNILCT